MRGSFKTGFKMSPERWIVLTIEGLMMTVALIFSCLSSAPFQHYRDYISLPLIEPAGIQKTDLIFSGYTGQPDMVETSQGKFIAVYPEGHGHGPLKIIESDNGIDWKSKSTPQSWKNSQEVPTLYTLDRSDGKQYLIMISGKPYWRKKNLKADGFQFSISKDGGEIWSELEKVWPSFDPIVAMSSLTQLKENGKYIDKWMGTFHNHRFVNYKTYLTFDFEDHPIWSKPIPLFSNHRSVERKNKICEIEIIRGPNDTLCAIGRSEKRFGHTSVISFSEDEGETWGEPKNMNVNLSGDRFQAAYDEKTGKLLISYRMIVPHKPHPLARAKFMTAGWVIWIGDFEDLNSIVQKPAGDCLVLAGKDPSGDCGYSGIVAKNGEAIAIAYGNFIGQGSNLRSVRFDIAAVLEQAKR